AITMLNGVGADFKLIRKDLELELSKNTSPNINTKNNIPLVKQAERVLKFMYLEAKVYRSFQIGTEHLLLSILKTDDCFACKVLNKYGIMYDNIAKNMDDSLEKSDENLILPKAEFPSSSDDEGDVFGAAK